MDFTEKIVNVAAHADTTNGGANRTIPVPMNGAYD